MASVARAGPRLAATPAPERAPGPCSRRAGSGCCCSSWSRSSSCWSYSLMPRGIYGGVEPRLHPGALRAVLRPALPRHPAAHVRLVHRLHRHLPAAGLSGGLRHRARRPLEEPAALPGGAAVLDQLPGPHLRHDLPACATPGSINTWLLQARADRRAAHHAVHAVRGDGGPGVRLPAVHDPPDLRLAREARPLAARGGRGAGRAPGRAVPAGHAAALDAGGRGRVPPGLHPGARARSSRPTCSAGPSRS